MPTARLVRELADKAQVATQRSWKRPFGVGLLVAGYDSSGARLFYNCPSGNFYDYKAFAIGARSQVGRCYAGGSVHGQSILGCSVRGAGRGQGSVNHLIVGVPAGCVLLWRQDVGGPYFRM